MPDLTIEYMYQCTQLESATVAGSRGAVYQLRRHRGRWTCTCKGFEFRGTCKHVKEQEANGCTWHQQVDGGEPKVVNGEKVCPECGSPAMVVKVAV